MQAWSIPRPTTQQTVEWMCLMARNGAKDMRIRTQAERIVRGITGKDYLAEALAVNRWVEGNCRYTRDVNSVELVRSAVEALESRLLDCDDFAVLIAALLLSLGHQVAFVTVAFGSGEYSHVFCQAMDQRTGKWVVLDPVAAPDVRGMLRRVRKYRIYPV